MPTTRRQFVATIAPLGALCAAGFVSLGTGCASDPPIRIQRYAETVSSLLLSRDGKHLVFIGNEYHYVFDVPPQLVQTLLSELHRKVNGHISSLHVDKQSSITGQYHLTLPSELSEQERSEAASLGFVADADGQLMQAGPILGKRYIQGTLRDGRQLEPLNKTYTVEITADQSPGDVVAGEVATPLTVGSDGVLLIYFIALAPLLIPLAIMTREPKR